MTLDKKRELSRFSLRSLLDKHSHRDEHGDHGHGHGHDHNGGTSHRHLLKDSRALILPQTSSSSLSSVRRRRDHTPTLAASLTDVTPVALHDPKQHLHLSLRRFFRKLKPAPLAEHHPPAAAAPSAGGDLFRQYGKMGRLLGTGALGAVSLITLEDTPPRIYAVKKFRAKLANETDLEYKTKVRNEYKIGEYLAHPNLIHTMELIKDHSKHFGEPQYYIVMEYAPYDFFNLVMSGLMDKREVACYFKQIVSGVAYLHANGLAHRDLKLDNCVVNEHGVLKLIDFGLAVQFRKEKLAADRLHPWAPHDDLDDKWRLVRARGIVGSDPYLAPEVFAPLNFGYDPRLVDVWLVAIIYFCMVLKRFPWKVPKLTDASYRLFAELESGAPPPSDSAAPPPSDSAAPQPPSDSAAPQPPSDSAAPQPPSDSAAPQPPSGSADADDSGGLVAGVQKMLNTDGDAPQIKIELAQKEDGVANGDTAGSAGAAGAAGAGARHHQLSKVRGPDRLLRILPSASRPLIRGMLAIDPQKRLLIEDVVRDPFFVSIQMCTQHGDTFVPAKDHLHHLVTEDDLRKIEEERKRVRGLKEAGMA
jgi:serine/threonine protein kinase